jgi:uncharacterized protein YndB with AHSA1/START domain
MEGITVRASIEQNMDTVWECWTKPEHIRQWNFATDEWHCPTATNDLHPAGRFSWRMEARDGSMGFDFSGTYTDIRLKEVIAATLDDGRKVRVKFVENNGATEVIETFEPDQNDREMQRMGWQAILNNFKKYAESQ